MPSAPDRSVRRRRPSISGGALGAPLFVLNLKTFPPVLGPGAHAVAGDLARAGREIGVAVAIAPAGPDLAAVASSVSIPVLAQHVDAVDAGASTGFVPAAAIAAAGARGSLVNHSEHSLGERQVGEACARLAEARLSAVVCARDPATAGRLAVFGPPYVAIEPPELIGGRRAVSTARPRIVSDGVRAVHAVSPGTHVLCGAGIHGRRDVRRSLELGAEGVLVASAVALARRPRTVIDDLLRGF
jgi:triosephosphate isomerase (TIM)